VSYLIAAYGISAVVLVVYVGLLHRERERLERGE
jgi:hypothetical protein